MRPEHGIHGNECALWSDTVSDVRHKKHKRVAIMRSLNNRRALANSRAHRRSLKHGLAAICVSCVTQRSSCILRPGNFYGLFVALLPCTATSVLGALVFPSSELLFPLLFDSSLFPHRLLPSFVLLLFLRPVPLLFLLLYVPFAPFLFHFFLFFLSFSFFLSSFFPSFLRFLLPSLGPSSLAFLVSKNDTIAIS